jgi:hypothetical protein
MPESSPHNGPLEFLRQSAVRGAEREARRKEHQQWLDGQQHRASAFSNAMNEVSYFRVPSPNELEFITGWAQAFIDAVDLIREADLLQLLDDRPDDDEAMLIAKSAYRATATSGESAAIDATRFITSNIESRGNVKARLAVLNNSLNAAFHARRVLAEEHLFPDFIARTDTLEEVSECSHPAPSETKVLTVPVLEENVLQESREENKGNSKRKHVEARMLKEIVENPDSQGWSARHWAGHLNCAESTVKETKTWKETLKATKALLAVQEAQKMDRSGTHQKGQRKQKHRSHYQ